MNIHDIVLEDPRIGDRFDLEIGDLLIETSIDDITEDGVVIRLDETALRLINQVLRENIQVDARLKSKIQRVMANMIDLDTMPYQQALEKITMLVFGRGNMKSPEHQQVIQRFFPDPYKRKMFEAEYRGRKVSLGKPFLTPDGPKKRSVYVKNAKGNVVKVNFGDKKMRIKKGNPARRKSFRARHNCSNPGPRWKARYWSCKFW